MTDLDKLIEAVEAGAFPTSWGALNEAGVAHGSYGLPMRGFAWEAYNGSLDAAKALHDALLPGWRMLLEQPEIIGSPPLFTACVWPTDATKRENVFRPAGTHANPARAWLLAILRAYRATKETQK